MISETVDNKDKFPIRELSSRTNVNTVTIRAWERRYGLLNPARTDKGHRLYSEQDVITIEKVRELIARGVPLNKVKTLLNEKINSSAINEDSNWAKETERVLAIIDSFSSPKTYHIISEVFASYPVNVCREKLIAPIFKLLRQNSDEAGYAFFENELLKYINMRLVSQKSQRKKDADHILVLGERTPAWRLALAAIELVDAKLSILLITSPMTINACIEMLNKMTKKQVLFYQDRQWTSKEKQLAEEALVQYPELTLCGTAPSLALLATEQVFSDLNSYQAKVMQS